MLNRALTAVVLTDNLFQIVSMLNDHITRILLFSLYGKVLDSTSSLFVFSSCVTVCATVNKINRLCSKLI
jgi:hypothetical protein